ncbi:MAG: conjugal transfer protein TraF [Methyloligellaceae bacterium]
MVKTNFPALGLTALCVFSTPSLYAEDVRSMGMGGASVSSGTGVAGAMSNPSLLLRAQQSEERYQFRFGFYGEARDNADLVDELDKNEDTFDEVDAEIERISEQDVTCVSVTPSPEDVCLTGTTELADLSDRLTNTFRNLDGEPIDGRAGMDIGFSVVHTDIPFSVNLSVRATGAGQADITDEDIAYTSDLAEALGDDDITIGEIDENASIALANNNGNIEIVQPDDVLTSEASGSVVIRTQFSVALARTLEIGANSIDFGVVPKISSLRAGDFTKQVDELDDDDVDLGDEVEESENTETSFTFDVGAGMALPSNENIRFGGVLRNVIAESIETKNGFEFETTPQAVVSALYHSDWFQLTGDLALNKAKEDNFETQELNLGTELQKSYFSFRAGVGHDLAADNDPTTFSVGVGLGFLDLGVRLNGSKVQGGLQIAFSL